MATARFQSTECLHPILVSIQAVNLICYILAKLCISMKWLTLDDSTDVASDNLDCCSSTDPTMSLEFQQCFDLSMLCPDELERSCSENDLNMTQAVTKREMERGDMTKHYNKRCYLSSEYYTTHVAGEHRPGIWGL